MKNYTNQSLLQVIRLQSIILMFLHIQLKRFFILRKHFFTFLMFDHENLWIFSIFITLILLSKPWKNQSTDLNDKSCLQIEKLTLLIVFTKQASLFSVAIPIRFSEICGSAHTCKISTISFWICQRIQNWKFYF